MRRATTRRAFLASTAAGAAAAGAFPAMLHAATDDPLTKLLVRAKATHTDAFVVTRNGELVAEFGNRSKAFDLNSVTKSIVSLAVGLLVDDGKLTLSDSVSNYYPQWKGGPKQAITIGQLLQHTSGLEPDKATGRIRSSHDYVRFALNAPLLSAPGTASQYNNTAYNLLPDIVLQITGSAIDAFLTRRIFSPLEIGPETYQWDTDDTGHKIGMSGLSMNAAGLMKFGALLLHDGSWHGHQLISKQWLSTAVAPQMLAPDFGSFWWLQYDHVDRLIDDATLSRWKLAGVPQTLIDRVAPLRGRRLTNEGYVAALEERLGAEGMTAWIAALSKAHTSGAKVEWGKVIGFNAQGYLGQYLLVYPKTKLCVVRLIDKNHYTSDDDDFVDILPLAQKIAM